MPKVLGALLEERDSKTGELETLTKSVEARVASWKEQPEETRGAEPSLTDDEERRSSVLVREVDELDARIAEEKRAEEKRRLIAEARSLVAPVEERSNVQVEDEPMVYGQDSPHSYINDLIRWYGGPQWADHEGAGKRLAEWAHQNEREVALNDKSERSRAALEQLRENFRPLQPAAAADALKEVRDRGTVGLGDKESRAIGTGGGGTASAGGGGGAAFVTPFFDVKNYAPWKEYGRAFADACHKEPLPPYGMEVYIPKLTAGAEVASQSTEGTAIAEKAVAAGYIAGKLETIAGQMIVSQQLLDRAGPNFAFDRMVFDQLERSHAHVIDNYVLTVALKEATEQSWSGNGGAFVLAEKEAAGGFYGQVAKAKDSIRTTVGTVLNATHLFTTATRWDYITAVADPNQRPVIVPNYAGPFNAIGAGGTGNNGIEGDTGYKLQGLPVFNDQNIPNQGTTNQDQAIVGCLDEVWVYEGPKIPRVVPQTLAQNLQVIIQLYSYVTALVRYPAGIVVINGTAMKAVSYTH